MTIAATAPIAASGGGDGFHAPGPSIFELPAAFDIGALGVTKPMLQVVLSAILVFGLLYAASRSRSLVPGKLQFAGEGAYNFVRNGVGRDIIGGHDFAKFVPYLVALFFFILINNLFATFPVFQFPTFSRSGMAYALAGLSWLVYNGVGIRKHGLLGYLKLQSVPSGVSPAMYPLLVPLEFFSNILVRPVTLALRLFCNMFAGHILLVLFSTGGFYLILEYGGIGYVAGPLALVLAIAVSFLELLIQFLQAYVFVLLNAMYIQGALADEH
ncbi:F0F1 ATP synthase subunit A [Nocardioides sp. zg-536]|uniref:ATP synthase subunit a n=1 Tax=Nocardioides faecalis TaxID=2803858 RepID=A0A938Y8R2_9ACTN|nr:F0F1 ATP synthase subunit A [Nocardioides faecalis]MBM9461279.1 F0F1 ATP synthase subunit A [Nocardioides faecalis]MBS4752415.1 F0F1 ATP synthase subunit A [Nocardioides faecalis]QVI57704.1 F0F1 ATP synthase subunit A [Nocardioides faecalis]